MLQAAGHFPTPLKGAPMWPLSVAAYRTLGEAGLIPKDTELLYSFVYRKMSKFPFHSYLVQLLDELLLRGLKPGMIVRGEQPLACGDSEPEPGLAVVGGRNEDFRTDHPHIAELVIEVCVSSHEYDRSKLRAHAQAGVKECWLVPAPEKQIKVHRRPEGNGYTLNETGSLNEGFANCEAIGFSIQTNDLFQ